MAAKEIPLTQGYVALVDEEDYARLSGFKWHAATAKHTRAIYARALVNKKLTPMHTFVMGLDPEIRIDHRDGNGLNNQKGNLRPANNQQNGANRPVSKNNKLGIKGVSRNTRSKNYRGTSTFRASIEVNGKQLYIGCFKTPIEAALAHDVIAIKYFGEFAKTNSEMGIIDRLRKESGEVAL